MKIILGSCYRPPNEDQTLIERLNNFLANICSSHQHIVLAGDFNLPQISWNSPEQTTGFSENAFIELLNDYFIGSTQQQELEKITFSILLSQTFRNWLKLAKFCPLLKQISVLITV
jgi:hypothetical protein